MATLRVRDWTKERLEEVQEEESHSTHDSVIKSLLKDRQLAQFAGVAATEADTQPESAAEPVETAVDGLTVLAELREPENGVIFLWCPNCESEIAHLSLSDPAVIDICEIDCQRCLTQLDQHAIVAIELSYPIEEMLVADALLEDIVACVLDYWNRTLRELSAVDADADQLVWHINEYAREFDWEWRNDVPVVHFEVGKTYEDERRGAFEVLDRRPAEDGHGTALEVRWTDDEDDATDVLDCEEVAELIRKRRAMISN